MLVQFLFRHRVGSSSGFQCTLYGVVLSNQLIRFHIPIPGQAVLHGKVYVVPAKPKPIAELGACVVHGTVDAIAHSTYGCCLRPIFEDLSQ